MMLFGLAVTPLTQLPLLLASPGRGWQIAYADDVVVTRRDEHGKAISSVSAPWLQAVMLEEAGLGPGQRVLEILGSGGYNAALMAELVGPTGEVTTVDIDPHVTARARRFLSGCD